MNEKNKEYKIGEVALVAAMISEDLQPLRIDKSYKDANGHSKTRVVFVFEREAAEKVEMRYLSKDLTVDARSYMDTINDVRRIIRSSVENRE